MPNTVEQYKDWLFVKVPKDTNGFELINGHGSIFIHYNSSMDRPGGMQQFLPPGQYTIIGKGDQIDWEGIITTAEITDPRGHQVTAKESGYSVIRSFGMEPGTTLVLKNLNK